MLDLIQTEGWSKYLKTQGWEVEKLKTGKTRVKAYIRKIPLFGTVIKIQRPKEIPSIEKIDKLAKKHRAIFVKLEPLDGRGYDRAVEGGFRFDPSPNLPTKTLVADLTKSEGELWSNLSQDARQSIRKARDNQLIFSTYKIDDKGFDPALKNLYRLLSKTGHRQKFWTPNLSQLQEKTTAFGKNGYLFIVQSKSGPPLAGALVLGYEGIHSASSEEGRHLYASYFLIWEVMRYLKRNGGTYHDLSGVYDPRFSKLTKRWQGFTTFKRKFGGQEFEYPHPLIKVYSPFFKLLSKFFKI